MKSQSLYSLILGVVSPCVFSALGSGQVCAPQPSSWWPGDGNATDLVAGNNGTLVGGVAFAPGKVGQAFSFNGSGYVSFGVTPSIIGTGPLTIELWLKTGGNGFILTQRDSGNFNGEYLLSVGGPPNGFGFAQVPGHLCWSEYGDNRLGFNFCSVSSVSDNVFHHIAVTREVDGTGRIYIDGVLDSSQASPPVTLVPLNVYLGEDVRDFQAPIAGLIDEVTLYKSALSQQAIRDIFLQGSLGKCKVGCVGQSLVPTAIIPTQAGNGGLATVTVTGCGLSGMTLSRTNQPDIVATNVQLDTLGSSITGTLDLRNRAIGAWDLIVSKSNGPATTLTGAFTIVQGGAPDVRIWKIGSPAVPGRNTTYFITLSNTGSIDSGPVPVAELVDPWFTFLSSTPNPSTMSQLPDLFPPSAIGTSYNAFPQWIVPNVPPGSSRTLTYSVGLDPSFPTGQPVNGTACFGSEEAMHTFHQLEVLCYTASVASCAVIGPACVTAIHACTNAALVVLGVELACHVYQQATRGSSDPNDLIGPPGSGPQRWILGGLPMQYSILFENLLTATKAATDITLTEQFDATTLDLTTLAVGPIAFGSSVYTPPNVPLAITPFTADVDLRPVQNLIVRINAALDAGTGRLTVNFISIDPTTGLPPTDVLVGFLPPGVGGSVVVNVKAKTLLATGTAINDQASIVFDTNAAILTPQWSNTIDGTKPNSHVLALAAVQKNVSFTVEWSGTDVGSGIQDYTVYVSDNGGPFVAWQTQTAATQATFTLGIAGHSYAFYSVARDLVGNLENSKTVGEASTRVIVDTTPPDLSVTLSPNVLWPPDHKLVAITADVRVRDNFDPDPRVVLVSITSNEADDGLGDGDTPNDIQGASFGTDDRSFSLRAERSAKGTGRAYTVTYRATDASGNVTAVSVPVTVPLDQGK
jgi:hypothetical protein